MLNMSRQGRNLSGSIRCAAVALLLACCLGAAFSAPRVQKLVKRSNLDPLLAMATDEEYIQVNPDDQSQQQEQTEVYQRQPQQADQPATELRQNVYYVTQENYQQPQTLQHYQEVHEMREEPDQQQNNQRQQEYVLVPEQQPQQRQQAEYPGQIVYIGQNGEISKIIQESQSPRQTQEQISQNIGDMVSPSSALPATILTEVPLKDLSGDVLDKLRRDYGVKVVATRDRPGANLVINCDGQEQTSICVRQDRNNNNNNNASPYEVEASTGAIEEQLAQVVAAAPIYSGPSSRSYFLRGPALEAAKVAPPTLEVTTTGQDIQRQYAAYIQEQPTVSVNPEVLDKSQYDDESSQQSRQQAVQQHQQQVVAVKDESNQAPIEVEQQQQQQQYSAEQPN